MEPAEVPVTGSHHVSKGHDGVLSWDSNCLTVQSLCVLHSSRPEALPVTTASCALGRWFHKHQCIRCIHCREIFKKMSFVRANCNIAQLGCLHCGPGSLCAKAKLTGVTPGRVLPTMTGVKNIQWPTERLDAVMQCVMSSMCFSRVHRLQAVTRYALEVVCKLNAPLVCR